MVDIAELRDYCDQLLASAGFDDYCPNGLQVEGDKRVRRLVTGVTASRAFVEAAVGEQADAILVHHGWFWKGESPCLVGMKGHRVRALVRAGISLLAYHLPLDAHSEFGNNRRLGDLMGIVDARAASQGSDLVWQGRLPDPVPGELFGRQLERLLGRAPLHIVAHDRCIAQIAWCTGAAQGFIEQAALLGVDAYVSGEISEQTTHQARELGLDYFAAGHHATERYGVQALGEHLASRFGIEHRFLELANPV